MNRPDIGALEFGVTPAPTLAPVRIACTSTPLPLTIDKSRYMFLGISLKIQFP